MVLNSNDLLVTWQFQLATLADRPFVRNFCGFVKTFSVLDTVHVSSVVKA